MTDKADQGAHSRGAAQSSPGHAASSPPGAPARRPVGRPPGTNYRTVDLPLQKRMRRMVEQGEVPTLTAAALQLAHSAYPPTSRLESKAKRLVATYPWLDE